MEGSPSENKSHEGEKNARSLFGQQINLGLHDEVRETYALKDAKSHALEKEVNPLRQRVAFTPKEGRVKAVEAFLLELNLILENRTPWHRGLLFWKNHTKENFGEKVWNSHDDDSYHNETASVLTTRHSSVQKFGGMTVMTTSPGEGIPGVLVALLIVWT
jgi:hypothetical protein